jgi:hypothetical protein
VVEARKLAGHAFISYVREDADRVDQLQQTLEAAGIPVWRDTGDLWPGQDWRAEIQRAITDNALVFIACFSRESLAREKSFQRAELALAIDQLLLRSPDVPWLIPVRLDDCDIPDRNIGGGRTLASIQRADLFGDSSSDEAARLVASVLRILNERSGNEAMPHSTVPRVGRDWSDAGHPGAAQGSWQVVGKWPRRSFVSRAREGQTRGRTEAEENDPVLPRGKPGSESEGTSYAVDIQAPTTIPRGRGQGAYDSQAGKAQYRRRRSRRVTPATLAGISILAAAGVAATIIGITLSHAPAKPPGHAGNGPAPAMTVSMSLGLDDRHTVSGCGRTPPCYGVDITVRHAPSGTTLHYACYNNGAQFWPASGTVDTDWSGHVVHANASGSATWQSQCVWGFAGTAGHHLRAAVNGTYSP